MQRGDVVLCSLSGDCGKVRPALIIQESLTLDHFSSVTICPITSVKNPAKIARISLKPSPSLGLERESQIMIDKITTIKKSRIKKHIGALPQSILHLVDKSLKIWLGLA